METGKQMKNLELHSVNFFGVTSIGNHWDVWRFSENRGKNPINLRGKLIKYWYAIGFIENNGQSLIGAITYYHVQTRRAHNKGEGMWFRLKQPLVGEERCVTSPNNGCVGD